MASKQDYYDILGIDRNASDSEIKTAYRKLAFQYHPDRNHEAGSEDKFKEINEAYEVLSNPEKRDAYDRFGHGGDTIFGQGFDGVGSIFDAFFGGRTTSTRQAPERGSDLQCNVTITLEETAFGVEKELNISRIEFCSQCHGIGSRPGSQPEQCMDCNGSGQIRRVQQSIFGRFTNVTTCPRCRGEGRVITDPCPGCRGTGKEKFQRNIMVNIPAGVDNGSRIRLSGEGNAGARGGHSGNLYVNLNVREHEFFVREEDDIVYELPINFAQAALGTEVEVPTLHGDVKLKVPAGTQTGHIFNLKNKGIPHLRGRGQGDQLVVLKVLTPESLTKKQRQLFEELSREIGDSKKK
ncbi:MAG: molecular chaperone DnaJ [Chloroflexi bacterium RBG_13_46_14]|nr:MAG: molecular chaperone DnaJ [Chloroflexi bacterium RBG_13_46_14]